MSETHSLTVKDAKFPLIFETDGEDVEVTIESTQKPADLPPGATPTTSTQDILDAMAMMKENIGVLATQVKEALQEHKPDEWSVEFNVGFKGKANIIPLIVQGEANSALKIHVKWKNSHPD